MSSNDCFVTILNSTDPLHTWLYFEPDRIYFSFDSANIETAITSNKAGKIETNEDAAKRKVEYRKKFPISRGQFARMVEKMSALSSATYALIPLKKDEYNCVVASNEVLKAGGIDFLDDVVTPFGVSSKIRGDPLYKEQDSKVIPYGLIPRASAAIVESAGMNLNNGPSGWIVGGALAAGAAYALFKFGQRNQD